MRKRQKRSALENVTHTRKATMTHSDGSADSTLSFVLVSDDNAGKRYDWGSGKYYDEILDVNGANVTQLNTFFKDHDRSVDSAVGKVQNVRVEDNMLVGDVVFGSDDESQTIYSKYRDGILTDVSIGYNIKDYVVKEREDANDEVTITDYEVFELSAVGIGFDKKAKKREEDSMYEELKARLAELEKMTKRTADEKAELAELTEKVRKLELGDNGDVQQQLNAIKAENIELRRKADIQAIATQRNVSEELTKTFLEDETRSVADFNVAILDELEKARKTEAQTVVGSVRAMGLDAKAELGDAIAIRMGLEVEKPTDFAMRMSHGSLTDIAGVLLGTSNAYDKIATAERSMVSGEFPDLLAGVGNRSLVAEFDNQPNMYKEWVQETDVADFRPVTEIRKGNSGLPLDKIGENSDLKERKFNESAESYKIQSYGNKIAITREMLINDDLNAFSNMISDFAEASDLLANNMAYDALTGADGFKFANGKTLYNASFNNKSNVAFSKEALQNAYLAMNKHKAQNGKTPVTITPQFLHINPSDMFLAREILNSTSSVDINKNAGVVNTANGLVIPIVSNSIPSGDWYLTAGTRTVKLAYLRGQNRRPQIKMDNSSLMGVKYDCVFDMGSTVSDYRTFYAGKKA